jgi:hypothetical protein
MKGHVHGSRLCARFGGRLEKTLPIALARDLPANICASLYFFVIAAPSQGICDAMSVWNPFASHAISFAFRKITFSYKPFAPQGDIIAHYFPDA